MNSAVSWAGPVGVSCEQEFSKFGVSVDHHKNYKKLCSRFPTS